MNFADRLMSSVEKKNSRLMVGLDPHLDLLPPEILRDVDKADRAAVATVMCGFCCDIIDASEEFVVAVKPQVAFFERLGPRGYEALEEVVAFARSRHLLIVSDCKRGDIGSTAAAYADYHLGSPSGQGLAGLGADAITLNAYLGMDSLEPFARHVESGSGLFILAKSSNQGSSDLQDKVINTSASTCVYQAVAELSQQLAGRYLLGTYGYSPVGIVVGATFPVQAVELRQAFPKLLFLVPGVGAQGASPSDIRGCFDKNGFGAIVNASRSILFAYRSAEFRHVSWQQAARNAASGLRDELNAAIVQS
jgi:orotidine-5'-phosphate decarboxylase